jgi:glutathione S-transferase
VITLYDYELSGNCYKVRLLLQLLGIPFERKEIDFHPGLEHQSSWFLALNPLGQLPVIDDAGWILRDAQAILVYLAGRYDRTQRWCPREDAAELATIVAWLSFADGLSGSAGRARLHDTLFFAADIEECRRAAHRAFRVLDEHLWFAEQEGGDWICRGAAPTIADIACFPSVMLSEEGGISRLPYPAIRRWTERVKRLEGFVTMPGIF